MSFCLGVDCFVKNIWQLYHFYLFFALAEMRLNFVQYIFETRGPVRKNDGFWTRFSQTQQKNCEKTKGHTEAQAIEY